MWKHQCPLICEVYISSFTVFTNMVSFFSNCGFVWFRKVSSQGVTFPSVVSISWKEKSVLFLLALWAFPAESSAVSQLENWRDEKNSSCVIFPEGVLQVIVHCSDQSLQRRIIKHMLPMWSNRIRVFVLLRVGLKTCFLGFLVLSLAHVSLTPNTSPVTKSAFTFNTVFL